MGREGFSHCGDGVSCDTTAWLHTLQCQIQMYLCIIVPKVAQYTPLFDSEPFQSGGCFRAALLSKAFHSVFQTFYFVMYQSSPALIFDVIHVSQRKGTSNITL